MTLSEHFRNHVLDLEEKALAGDEPSIRSLAAIALLLEGWRPGDPDPDGEPDGGGEVIDLAEWLHLRQAA